MTKTAPRLLLYVQHLLGVGHVKRASVIARTAAADGWSCDVVLGGPDAGPIEWGGAVCHQLPAVRSPDATFSRYLTDDGTEPDEDFWQRRRTRAVAMASRLVPDVLVIEQYPFGRRRFRHEITAMIETARSRCPALRVFCSVRDILVSGKSADKDRLVVETLRRDFDGVLVHGDPAFIPFGESFRPAREIEDMLTYTGYVTEESVTEGELPFIARENGPVIVAAGGGAVGARLLSTAMIARREGLLDDRAWLFLVGPNLDRETASQLRRDAPAGVSIEPNRPDYPSLLAQAYVSVSQAGYNTVMDIVRARCPAVVVPLGAAGETEQLVRAAALDRSGYLVSLNESALTPANLSHAIGRAACLSIPVAQPFRMDGARETVRMLSRPA